jgi:N-acetylmuramoyl-L-alanine amidase
MGVVAAESSAPVVSAQPDLTGMTVALDPGHSGRTDASLSRQIPDGRGGMKQCQTSGTSTDGGYPEHTFNWAIVQLINAALVQQGVRTALSRDSDDGVGPCNDARAAAANALQPNASVSIHADGGPPGGHGFHVNYSSPPLNEAQAGPSLRFATIMRDQLAAAGMQPSTYIGTNGLYGRSDLAGLNFAEHPTILIEVGNMRNADDAAQMISPGGRSQYASAIVQGITAFLRT